MSNYKPIIKTSFSIARMFEEAIRYNNNVANFDRKKELEKERDKWLDFSENECQEIRIVKTL